MPTISMFYGILVTLFYEDNKRHHTPHFHVRYQGSKASIAIDDGRVCGQHPGQAVEISSSMGRAASGRTVGQLGVGD